MVSFADDAVILFFNGHGLSLLRGLISLVTMFMAVVGVYGMMIGITSRVPKRLLLPIPMFFLAAMLAMFTLAIFFHHHIEQIAFGISSCQLLLGLGLVNSTRREKRYSWPWVQAEQLGARGFSWRHLCAFVAANLFVLLPFVFVYIFFFSARAVNRFSEGFVALHPGGLTMQVRKYERNDGKMIELFPMAHIADESFYRQVSQSFPTNSVVLLEGVSDDQNLLTNKITYKRMANTLGLSEQRETFAPGRGDSVAADVDVRQFSASTLGFSEPRDAVLHSRGVTACCGNPGEIFRRLKCNTRRRRDLREKLFDDLLTKRNQHLLGEIEAHLQVSDNIMVPWGAAHMPGLAREIQKSGFHLSETTEVYVIRFGHRGKTGSGLEH